MFSSKIKKLKLTKKSVKEMSFFSKKDYSNIRLSTLDEIYFETKHEHLKILPSNESLTPDDIEDLLRHEKEKNHKDYNFFLYHKNLHELYVKKLQKVFTYDFFNSVESFEQMVDDKIIDLSQITQAQTHYNLKDESKDIAVDERKEILKNAKLYEICRDNSILPFSIKKEVNGEEIWVNYLGLLFPTREINSFKFDNIVFISPEIINQFAPYTIQDFAFFENKSLSDSTGYEIVQTMLERMINDGYSDLSLFRFSENYYAVMATKYGRYYYLTTKMPIELAKVIIIALLKRMGADKTSKEPAIKRMIKLNLGGVERTFRCNMLRQSKTELRGDSFDRTVSIRSLSDLTMISDIENIGYPHEIIKILKHCIENGNSIAFTGETNSGKTTQEYTCAVQFYKNNNSKKRNFTMQDEIQKVITISSPREYNYDGFFQYDLDEARGTKHLIGLDTLLPNIMQQNPKLVCLDEIKSKEDMRIYVEQVLKRGHAGYTSFHSGNNQEAIHLLSMNSEQPISSFIKTLRVWINTELVSRVCSKCHDNGDSDCDVCSGSGAVGVVPVIEFTYFKDNFQATGKDDALDFKTLIKEKKILHIPKSMVAKSLYDSKMIRKKDFDRITGKLEEKLISELSDVSKLEALSY